MRQIIDYIENKRAEYESHKLFTDLLDNATLSGEEKLAFGPCVIPFIMGYSDLNKSIFRNESPVAKEDMIQMMLNEHTYEEDFHWQWLLDDLEKLNCNHKFSLAEAARIFWSPEMKASRRLCLNLAGMVAHASSYMTFAIVEAIESVSITIFKHCQGIKLADGTECEFFGTKHYLAEAGHTIKDEKQNNDAMILLTEEQRRDIIRQIDNVFEMFSNWSDSLFSYAKKYSGDHLSIYRSMIQKSLALPRDRGVSESDKV